MPEPPVAVGFPPITVDVPGQIFLYGPASTEKVDVCADKATVSKHK